MITETSNSALCLLTGLSFIPIKDKSVLLSSFMTSLENVVLTSIFCYRSSSKALGRHTVRPPVIQLQIVRLRHAMIQMCCVYLVHKTTLNQWLSSKPQFKLVRSLSLEEILLKCRSNRISCEIRVWRQVLFADWFILTFRELQHTAVKKNFCLKWTIRHYCSDEKTAQTL